ncbi:hypothetical protein [Candidatus Phytoplasma prunorum]|uniref:hypothetical protein n=1 Tax=Candidatus Phytoplasma prunorum TaxID=47565 RepID=UPI002FF14086
MNLLNLILFTPSLPKNQSETEIKPKILSVNEPQSKNEHEIEPTEDKFKITANEFTQIKAYIFALNADVNLLPSNLPLNAITIINQTREKFIKKQKNII